MQSAASSARSTFCHVVKDGLKFRKVFSIKISILSQLFSPIYKHVWKIQDFLASQSKSTETQENQQISSKSQHLIVLQRIESSFIYHLQESNSSIRWILISSIAPKLKIAMYLTFLELLVDLIGIEPIFLYFLYISAWLFTNFVTILSYKWIVTHFLEQKILVTSKKQATYIFIRTFTT